MLDTGLKFYAVPSRPISVTLRSRSQTSKFLVKVFRSLYLLKLQLDPVDTLPDVRYWSRVLRCTIITHISDLEVKVTDFEILS